MAGAVLILGKTFFEKKFINNTKNCSTLKRKDKMNRILKYLSATSLTLLLSLGQGFSGELVIGFGSCLDQDLPPPLWEDINAQNPEVFIILKGLTKIKPGPLKKQGWTSHSWQSGMIMIMEKMMEE